MSKIKALRAALAGIDLKTDTDAVHEDRFFTILNQLISHPKQSQTTKPPLDILVHALKFILYPSFVPERSSDFLRLITQVEFHRLTAVEQASDLLEWHTYYSRQPSPEFHLNAVDEAYVMELKQENGAIREIYMTIVADVCAADMKRLWMESSNTDFWIRWNEYFADFKEENKPKPLDFHYKLSAKDLSKLCEVPYKITQFMEHTVRYAAEQGDRGQSIQDVFQTSSFRHQFEKNETSLSPITLGLIEYYLDYVPETVRCVEVLSGPSSETAS